MWGVERGAACSLQHVHFDISERPHVAFTFTTRSKACPSQRKSKPTVMVFQRGSNGRTTMLKAKCGVYGGTVEMVKDVIALSNYPSDNFIFVKGMVEDTMPSRMPENISLLRLDTDLYRSTYHELVHCYPLISSGGIMIVDDYGYYLGCRKATDKYISENNLRLFLAKLDGSGHITVKP